MYTPLADKLDFGALGHEMHAFATKLYPICRSITGDGIRQTLNEIKTFAPLQLHEIPTGTSVLDWTVPREWNIRDAYITDLSGKRLVDFKMHNLHVVNYSIPIRARMHLADLRPHLYTLPDRPDWIPYRTSYYKETWGFCLTHRQLESLAEDTYDVCIDSTLEIGNLTYGEFYCPGETTDEILISCHACHPSLANDNLSGISLAAELAKAVSSRRNRLSYRFLFLPGTIGSIAWLALNEKTVHQIIAGLVVACVGDSGQFRYKQSRQGNALIDRVVDYVLRQTGQAYELHAFSPYGYDERQYCSPGFNLPVGSLTRTPHGQYPEYHTSADNLDLITPDALGVSLQMYCRVFDILEQNRVYRNTSPRGEPQLGRRGLYRLIGGKTDAGQQEMALLWVLNLSDNTHTLLDIAERSGLPFESVALAASRLLEAGLLDA